MKGRFRIAFHFLLLAFFLSMLFWHRIIIYGLEQGYGQIEIIRGSVPIGEVLKQPSLPDSVRSKLLLSQEIRRFAFDSLGINYSENYTDFYDHRGRTLLITFSACEPFYFRAKEWTYPVLGTVSYKGYFDLEKARKEIRKLRAEGYDVDAYSPSGWSTLGWFNDPVLSSMLRKNEGELADLIIHELTHGTLYVRNNVTFNENLASFVGAKGAERFLRSRFGRRSGQYLRFLRQREDDKRYKNYILGSMKRLDSLYAATEGMEYEERKMKKQAAIREIVVGLSRIRLHDRNRYIRYTTQAFREGNAFFLAFVRYDSQYELLDEELRRDYRGDLLLFMQAMKRKYPSL